MLYIVAAIVIVLDQITKAMVRSTMLVGDSTSVIPGVVYLTHVRNPGAAFGILPNHQVVFLLVSVAVVALLVFYYQRIRKADSPTTISLGMVMGGAIGNLIDRLTTGMVTDFIDFRFWPVFNLADSAIVVGVIYLAIVLFKDAAQEQLGTE